MRYYLKKYWFANLLAILPGLIVCALRTGNNFLMIWSFQSIIELNLLGFLFWNLMMTAVWFLVLWVESLGEFFQGRAIRKMNHAVRSDMTATLLSMSYRDFHSKDTGEFLSWFTNDVNQIEGLAWRPFYQCIDSAATVICCTVALLTLHWSLLAAALVNVVVMMLAPQLFTKHMEKLGESCEAGQSKYSGSVVKTKI